MKNIASYHTFLWYTYRTTNSPEALETSPLANSRTGAGIIIHHPTLPVLVLIQYVQYDELAPFVAILVM
jgi:hypothetical protein